MHYVTWLGLWLKVKCLNREEFVDPDGRLIYAGRVGSGMGYRFSVPTVIGQCW
jgi:hypothetical protein